MAIHDAKAPAPPSAGSANPATDDPGAAELYLFAAEEGGDRRRLRAAVAVALAFHALLLLVPNLRSETVAQAEEPPRQLLVIQPVRFKPPEPPPPERPPEQKPTVVPVPDPTPLDPEPLRDIDAIPLPADRIGWNPVPIDFPDAPPEPEPDEPILVGGDVARPQAIFAPKPLYTEVARKTRIQGPVILQVVLDKQGLVHDVQVLKGLPMGLTEQAVDAVSRWRYQPATLNDKPVEVYMTITIFFNLQ